MNVPDPIPVEATAGTTAASVVFRHGDTTCVTAIAKVTLALVAGAPARWIDPDPIVRRDVVDPNGQVIHASDLAPTMPGADILVVGTVAPALAVGQAGRLRYCRASRVLIDKVFAPGPRTAVGVGVAALGPVARTDPSRRALAGADPEYLAGNILLIPPALDWAFFHAAVADQRVDVVHAGDSVVVEGMLRDERFEAILPHIVGEARLFGPSVAAEGRAIALRPDALVLDVGRRVASVVLRGYARLGSEAARHRLTVRADAGPRSPAAAASPQPFEGRSTHAMGDDEVQRLRAQFATPFDRSRAEGRAGVHPPPAVSAPVAAAPQPVGARAGETHEIAAEDVAKLRAQFATPFSAHARSAPLPPTPPPAPPPAATPAATRPEPVTWSSPPIPHVPAAAAPPPVPEPASVPKLQHDYGSTAPIASDEVARLRAAFKLPFRPGAPGAAPPAAAPTAPTSKSAGDTAERAPEEVEEIRAAFLPFQPATARGASRRAKRPPKPLESGESLEGLGKAFLHALADVETGAA